MVPMCSEPCQTPKTAPPGSEAMASRPASPASIGPTATVPPQERIASAVRSASSVAR